MSKIKQALIEAVYSTGSLQFGDFTLKSGAKSDFYLDCRILTTTSLGAVLVSEAIYEVMHKDFDAIGGPSIGADPIVGAFLSWYGMTDLLRKGPGDPDALRGFMIRSAEKDHGKSGLVVGSVRPGDRCVVVEDVTTSGGSLIKAIEEITKFGCEVVQAITIVDRLAGAATALAALHIPFTPLLTIDELNISKPSNLSDTVRAKLDAEDDRQLPTTEDGG